VCVCVCTVVIMSISRIGARYWCYGTLLELEVTPRRGVTVGLSRHHSWFAGRGGPIRDVLSKVWQA